MGWVPEQTAFFRFFSILYVAKHSHTYLICQIYHFSHRPLKVLQPNKIATQILTKLVGLSPNKSNFLIEADNQSVFIKSVNGSEAPPFKNQLKRNRQTGFPFKGTSLSPLTLNDAAPTGFWYGSSVALFHRQKNTATLFWKWQTQPSVCQIAFKSFSRLTFSFCDS